VFGITPIVGIYRSTIFFSPLESVSTVWPSLVVEVLVILVDLTTLTWSFLSSFSANATTWGGRPVRI